MGRITRRNNKADSDAENDKAKKKTTLNKRETKIGTRKILSDQTNSSFKSDKNVSTSSLKSVDNCIIKDSLSGNIKCNEGQFKLCKEPLPIYASKKLSPISNLCLPPEERLHLYDFEVDKNEPNIKRRRKPIKKKIKCQTYNDKVDMLGTAITKNLKKALDKSVEMKQDDKIKTKGSSFTLRSRKKNVNKENVGLTNPDKGEDVCKGRKKQVLEKANLLKPVKMSIEEPTFSHSRRNIKLKTNEDNSAAVLEKRKKDNYDLEKMQQHSVGILEHTNVPSCSSNVNIRKIDRNQMKTPHDITEIEDPYSLPIILPEMSNVANVSSNSVRQQSVYFPKSPKYKLDVTNVSNLTDRSNLSFRSDFVINDLLYVGSSTPIRTHWAERSSLSKPEDSGDFDVSNCFGFEDDESLEEPLISPIKSWTPGIPGSVVKKKATPKKPSCRNVIRMLKFGPDAEDHPENESSSVEMPDNFFHDGDTPTFSPVSITSSPVLELSIKSSQKSYLRPRKRGADKGKLETVDEECSQEEKEMVTRMQHKKGGETKIKKYKVSRKSYTRNRKKVTYAESSKSDTEDEKTMEVQSKKKVTSALSKKEARELEKWASAFNQQCMEVEKFDLCVE